MAEHPRGARPEPRHRDLHRTRRRRDREPGRAVHRRRDRLVAEHARPSASPTWRRTSPSASRRSPNVDIQIDSLDIFGTRGLAEFRVSATFSGPFVVDDAVVIEPNGQQTPARRGGRRRLRRRPDQGASARTSTTPACWSRCSTRESRGRGAARRGRLVPRRRRARAGPARSGLPGGAHGRSGGRRRAASGDEQEFAVLVRDDGRIVAGASGTHLGRRLSAARRVGRRIASASRPRPRAHGGSRARSAATGLPTGHGPDVRSLDRRLLRPPRLPHGRRPRGLSGRHDDPVVLQGLVVPSLHPHRMMRRHDVCATVRPTTQHGVDRDHQ